MNVELIQDRGKMLIIPVLLLVILLISIGSFYGVGGIIDTYACSIQNENISEYMEGIIFAGNTTHSKVISYGQMNNEVTNLLPILNMGKSLSVIDPMMPLPCEVYHGNCFYYFSQESYDCLTVFLEKNKDSLGPRSKHPIRPYETSNASNPMVIILILLSSIIILVEGYIISYIILFFHKLITNTTRANHKKRKKRRWFQI